VHDTARRVGDSIGAGEATLVLGGDCTVGIGTVGEHGAASELINVGARVPLLDPDQILLLGWGPEQATAFEREAIERHGIPVLAVHEVAADPESAAARARESMENRCDRLLVHFDVDVIDFTDVPLSENCGRNEGLAYEQALRALDVLLASQRLAGLTITELNPAHTEEGAHSIERFATDIAHGLARSLTR
jgi:arginase